MIYTDTIDTPLGAMAAAAKEDSLIGLWFVGQKYYPAETSRWVLDPDHHVFRSLRNHLDRYFSGVAGASPIRLDPSGSPFQKAVWHLLLKIPLGRVTTYGEIARQFACAGGLATMSAQAVGGAVGHNPISILIPCHRVVGSQGSLTGYAGGLDRKAALLRIEKVELAEKQPDSALQLFSFTAVA
jgi:methylated-DNA-[protein]-cysteine S-methyltransferase